MKKNNNVALKPNETISIRKRLISWYVKNKRQLPWRKTGNPYAIWVSEVMLQQTQVKTVIPYYKKFLAAYPNLNSFADADLQTVLKHWEGLGYYARARNFHRAALKVVEHHKGEIPRDYNALRKLPGIGDYIASAILSIAFGKPYAVVDGNVKRVLARLSAIDEPVNKSSSHDVFKTHANTLLDTQNSGMFNQAMMELGALICTPKNPGCDICPVKKFCSSFNTGTTDQYPKRIKSPPVPTHHIAVGVVFKNNHVLITQRKPDGLLGSLWEFPGGKVKKNESSEKACIREIKEEVNLVVEVDSFVKQVKHAYTHFKIIMDVYTCRFVSGRIRLKGPVDHKWVKLHNLARFPFPKANLKFIPKLLEENRVLIKL